MNYSKTNLLQDLKNLEAQYTESKNVLLQKYKSANQKYPIGFKFPYQGELAKVTGCFARFHEPDSTHFDYSIHIAYTCYIASWCDYPIDGIVLGDHENVGVELFQEVIDRALDIAKEQQI